MNKNKINIEITADGWKTDVTINGKTYTERYDRNRSSGVYIEGDFEQGDEIPEPFCDIFDRYFCSECQQILAQFEIEEEIEEE